MRFLRRSQQRSPALVAVPVAKPSRRSKRSTQLARMLLPSQHVASYGAQHCTHSSGVPLQRCAAVQSGSEEFTAGAVATRKCTCNVAQRRSTSTPMYRFTRSLSYSVVFLRCCDVRGLSLLLGLRVAGERSLAQSTGRV